jgi:hypothetical protein
MRGNVQKRPDIFSTGRVGIHQYGWVLLGVAQAFIFSIAGISSQWRALRHAPTGGF